MNNMPLDILEISKMNAFEALWNCSKDHLDDVAIKYMADINVCDINKKVLVNKITYKELFRNILNTYNSLIANGVKKGDII